MQIHFQSYNAQQRDQLDLIDKVPSTFSQNASGSRSLSDPCSDGGRTETLSTRRKTHQVPLGTYGPALRNLRVARSPRGKEEQQDSTPEHPPVWRAVKSIINQESKSDCLPNVKFQQLLLHNHCRTGNKVHTISLFPPLPRTHEGTHTGTHVHTHTHH